MAARYIHANEKLDRLAINGAIEFTEYWIDPQLRAGAISAVAIEDSAFVEYDRNTAHPVP